MDSSVSLESQMEKIEQRLKESSIPDDLLERIEAEIAIVRSSLNAGASFINFESLSNYVNWVGLLPFDRQTKDLLDLKLAKQILDKNHYGLGSVKDRILEYLSSLILNIENRANNQELKSPVLCLVGLVGTGKTTLAYSIAEALGRKFERIPFGGMGNAKALRGQSRAVADAQPGFIIKSLVHAQSKNCVILLDELDRVTEEERSDIMGVLLELLDAEQNKAFVDHYIDYPFDLSHVLFIATANNTTNISTAVLDRLEIIQMPSLTDEEKITIAKSFLFPKIRLQTGLSENKLTIDDIVWPKVVRPLGFDSGIRSLERTIEAICRKVARLVVEGKVQSVQISNENIKEFLPV